MSDIHLEQAEVGLFSDPHLGIHQGNETWHEIALEFAERTAKFYADRNIKDILILGDIFNDREEIGVNTIHMANSFFQHFKPFNVVVVVGNHDAFYRDRSDVNSVSVFDNWPNVTVVSKPTVVQAFGKTLAFCPWATKLEDIPQSDILFGHLEIAGFYQHKLKVCERGPTPPDILKKTKKCFSGHFHVMEERKYQQGTIMFVGNPFQQSWNDYGLEKGIFTLNIMSGHLDFFPNLYSPVHQKINLSDLQAKPKAAELKKKIEHNLVKFTVDKPTEIEKIRKLEEFLFAFHPLSLKTEFEDEGVTIEDAEDKDFSQLDVEGAINEFIDLMDIDYKDALKHFMKDLHERALKE